MSNYNKYIQRRVHSFDRYQMNNNNNNNYPIYPVNNFNNRKLDNYPHLNLDEKNYDKVNGIIRRNKNLNIGENINQGQYAKYHNNLNNNNSNNNLNNQKNIYGRNENIRELYEPNEYNNEGIKRGNFDNNKFNKDNRIDIGANNADYNKRLQRGIKNVPQNEDFKRNDYKINNRPQSCKGQPQQKKRKEYLSYDRNSKNFYNNCDDIDEHNFIANNDIRVIRKNQNTNCNSSTSSDKKFNDKYNIKKQQEYKEAPKYDNINQNRYNNYSKKVNDIINYKDNIINVNNQNENKVQNNQAKREQFQNNNRNNILNEKDKKNIGNIRNNFRNNNRINNYQAIKGNNRDYKNSEMDKEEKKEKNIRNYLNQEKNDKVPVRVPLFNGHEKFGNNREENNNQDKRNAINAYKYNLDNQNTKYSKYKKDEEELINNNKNKKIEGLRNDRMEYYNKLNQEIIKEKQEKEFAANQKKEDALKNNEIGHITNHNVLNEYKNEKKTIYRYQPIFNDNDKKRNLEEDNKNINKEKQKNENLYVDKQKEQNNKQININNNANQSVNRFHYQNYNNNQIVNNDINKKRENIQKENNNENDLLNTRIALQDNKKVIKNDFNNKHEYVINSDETKMLIEPFLNQINIQQKNKALVNNYINDDRNNKNNIIDNNNNKNNINNFISNNNNNINNFKNNNINNNNNVNKNNFINNNPNNNQNNNQLNNNFNNINLQRQNNFNLQNNNNQINNKRDSKSPIQNHNMNLNNQNNNNNFINNKHLRAKSHDNIIVNQNNQPNNNFNFNNNNLNFNNQMNINQNNWNLNINNNANFDKNNINNMQNIQQNNNINLNNNNIQQIQQKNFGQFNKNMNMNKVNNINNPNQINNNLQNFNNNNGNVATPFNNNIMNNNAFVQNNNNFNNFNNNRMNLNSNPLMVQNNNFFNFKPNGFNNNLNNQFMLNNNMMMNNFQTPAFNQFNANFNQAQFNINQMQRVNSSPNLHQKPINLPKPPAPPKPSIIKKPYANGLQNIGATCYMNATIQCLAHVQSFVENLLKNRTDIKKNGYKKKLSNSFLEVIENIWEKYSIKYYAPYNFKNLISQMNPLFAGIQANDSKDLVLFLLETMHNELNKVKDIPPFDNNTDQYNFEKNFAGFVNYFQNNFQSIVSDIFYGMYNSRMQCLNCNAITHNIQCYNILIIPLEEVRKFKNRMQNYVNIIECFEYYQKPEYMMGQNQIYCNNCKQMANSINTSTLIVGPKVLIINLNRGKGLQFDIKLDFTEYLNILNFIYFKETPTNYKLIGVVTHFGPSGDSGHFIAFCKSFVDNKWYKYNDAIVSPSSFKEARDTGVPYILFYSAE